MNLNSLKEKCLTSIKYPDLNINPIITENDLSQIIQKRIYWIVQNDPQADSHWELLGKVTTEIMSLLLENWHVNKDMTNQLYDGICSNCSNYSNFLQYGICNICRDFAQNGMDVEPYFLSENEKNKQLSNIKNDFFPVYNIKQEADISLEFLRSLIDELAYIPKSTELDYSNNPGRGNLRDQGLWLFVMHCNIKLFRELSRTYSGKWYKQKYSSWLNTLVQANVLPNAQRKTPYGTMCLANDGHVCNSIGEKIIDDWLHRNNIGHMKEPLYPEHSEFNPEMRLRADWKVGQYYVEFCGLKGLPFYDEKMKTKRQLSTILGIRFVEIFQENLSSLDQLLNFLLSSQTKNN